MAMTDWKNKIRHGNTQYEKFFGTIKRGQEPNWQTENDKKGSGAKLANWGIDDRDYAG
jgi:hypothetical protein